MLWETVLPTLSRAPMQTNNKSIWQISQKLRLAKLHTFIENKNTPIPLANVGFKVGSVLAFAMLMTACNPTEATQKDGSNVTGDAKNISLLNVSYDVSRDFYKDYNVIFSADYQKKH